MDKYSEYSVIRNFDYSQPFAEGVLNRGRKEHQSSHILSKTCLDLFLPSSDNSANTSTHSAMNLKTEEGNGVVESTKRTTTDENGYGGSSQYSAKGIKDDDEMLLTSTFVKGTGDTDQVTEVRKRERNGELHNKDKRTQPPLVVFAYGGGWRRGDKQTWRHYISRWDINLGLATMVGCDRFYSNIGESFASRGFPCAILSYPLVPTPFPINFIEIGTSFLLSLIFTLLLTSLLCLVLDVLLFSMSYHLLTHKLWNFLQNDSDCPALSAVAAIIILSQLLTLTIIVCRELYLESRNSSQNAVSRYVPLAISCIAITTTVLTLDLYSLCSYIAKSNFLTLAFSGTFVIFVQYLVYHFQQKTTFTKGSKRSCLVATPQGQAESVGLALKWLVDYGRSTGHFDSESIILMGHSAGGHLVSLVALDHHYLMGVGISPKVIKGVITLSAVHDLQTISKGVLYHTYLKPAFGIDPAYWTRMSPIQYVKISESENSVSNSGQASLSVRPTTSSSSSSSSPSSSSSSSSTFTTTTSSSSYSSPCSSSMSSSRTNTSRTYLSSPTATASLTPSAKSSTQLPEEASSPTIISQSSSSSSSSSHPAPSPPLSSSSSLSKAPSAHHRPHFLILNADKDFDFMIEDSDRMHCALKSKGYETRRNSVQGCNHFTMVRKFGCPRYRYWTSRILGNGGISWKPSDGELLCWEFVQQFWNDK